VDEGQLTNQIMGAPKRPWPLVARLREDNTLRLDLLSIGLLLLVYSPFLAYDYGWHIDYYMLTKPYLRTGMYNSGWENLFIFAEAPYLIRIGRLLNAILVSLQAHFAETIEALRLIRTFYVAVLLLLYIWLSRIFADHFGLAPAGACILSLLFCMTPPMQQAVFMVTFSPPVFVAFATAVKSYLLYARAAEETKGRLRSEQLGRFAVPFVLMIISLSCYSLMSMFFVVLALLEVIVAARVGLNTSISVLRFTIHVAAFVLVSIAAYFVIDRLIFYVFFANNPAVMRTMTTPFYSFSLSLGSLVQSVSNRLFNFWLCYDNAAGLWDMDTHRLTIVIVTLLAGLAILQPALRWASIAVLRPRHTLLEQWQTSFWREVMTAVCKVVLFVFTVLPFLVPDIRASWETGYRDSFRTLPAMEAAILVLLYDFFRQLPFTVLAIGVGGARSRLASWLSAVNGVRVVGTAAIVVLASTLAFRSMDVGSTWAVIQLKFYQSLSNYLESSNATTLVTPCGHGDTWYWDSPGIRGEYGFTSIRWDDYIVYQLRRQNPPRNIELVCSWEATQFGTDAYVEREGETVLVDYVRFIRDYSPYSAKAWHLPFEQPKQLFANAFDWRKP
jgi:hypothetical protein